jgi:hypothetical protein
MTVVKKPQFSYTQNRGHELMKRAIFLAALCLLSLSLSNVASADNGLPKQWNFGDAVYGHEVQWNFDEVMNQIGSGTSVASLTARVASAEADIDALQAENATQAINILANTAAIATHTAQIASLSINDGTIQKLAIGFGFASESLPFTWSTTALPYFQLVDGDVLRFRFDYACYQAATGENKWGTIDGAVRYSVSSGTSFVPTATSLMTFDGYSAGASAWSVIASCADAKLQFIASFPVSVRAFGTCTITGK